MKKIDFFLKVVSKYKIKELIIFTLDLFFMKVIRILSTLVFKLKCFINNIRLGKYAKVWGKVIFKKYPGSEIHLGNNIHIISSPSRYSFNIYPQSKITTLSPSAKIIIEDSVGFNSLSVMCRSKTILIGRGTLIGGNCQIMDTDGHSLWPAENRFNSPGIENDKSVKIGENVFIGLNVIILKGVNIGDNTIIAAGSVVSNSIPANCVAAGVPAKIIKSV